MRYIIVLLIKVSFLNAQINNQALLKKYMSNYPLSDIGHIYKLSKTYSPALDSIKSIIVYNDNKVKSGNDFSSNDKYRSKSYGFLGEDIVDGKITETFFKRNIWFSIAFKLNVFSEEFYTSAQICEQLEEVYCNLSHKEHIGYIEKYGLPKDSFIHLLYHKKYKEFKKVDIEDFRGLGNDLNFKVFINSIDRWMKLNLVKYDGVLEQDYLIHPKRKKLYLAALNYLEWDNDLKTMKKILSKIDSDFGSDSDFGKFRAMVTQ